MPCSTISDLDHRQGDNIRSILKEFHDNGRFLSAHSSLAERVAERVYGRSERIRKKISIIQSRRWR